MYTSVFLFYGENTYALRQELQRRKVNFLERYGQDALFHFSNQNRDLGMIKQALYAGGLFVSKKMVIIEGVPKDTSEGNTLSADKIEKFFEDFQQNLSGSCYFSFLIGIFDSEEENAVILSCVFSPNK